MSQDSVGLKLHNGPVNAVMRAALRRVRTFGGRKSGPMIVPDSPVIPEAVVSPVSQDEDDNDKKLLPSGKYVKAGVGKKLNKALLAMWNSDGLDLDNTASRADTEYGSGDESTGESHIVTDFRTKFQFLLSNKATKEFGLGKGQLLS